MQVTETQEIDHGLLASILSDEDFRPSEPRSIDETGLSESFIEGLLCKSLAVTGTCSGRSLAEQVCLPFGILEPVFNSLRARQIIVHAGSAPFNDYYYTLTQGGRAHAQNNADNCAYVGPAPVPLMDYVISVEAQSINAESPRAEELAEAFREISVDEALFESLGPAVNSGAGMFLYGAPGNGKSTLAQRITMCFGQAVWIPHAILESGQLIKFFDAAYHAPIEGEAGTIIKTHEHDRRWVKVRRPTVVVGGELTMDNLEIRHNAKTNVSEAPLQLKSNCGCLLLDDFGRQRVAPAELLNRWIIPLENRHDFLTLATGKKIRVPFDQLIIFSTNLEPRDLVDEAFLRRIPYKIEIGDPSEEEFQQIFELCARNFGCQYEPDAVEHLLEKHYRQMGRPLRRCHPRDLLTQVRNHCRYQGMPLEMRPELFDRVVRSYFTAVLGTPDEH